MNRSTEYGRELQCYNGGLESKLDLTALVILVIGLVVAMYVLLVTSFLGVIPAIAFAVNGWIGWLALHGLAELVRLQKRANGLPYSGSISVTKESRLERCATCGAVHSEPDFCPHCKQAVTEKDQFDESE